MPGRWPTALALFAFFLLLHFAARVDAPRLAAPPLPASPALLYALPQAILWTLVAYAAAALARRFAIGPGAWLRNAALHLAAAALVGALDWAATVALDGRLGLVDEKSAAGHWVGAVLLFALLDAAAHILQYLRWHRQKQIDELRLRAELDRAALARVRSELRAARTELNPDFLLATLADAESLAARDAARAGRLIVHLSELLRGSLRRLGSQQTPLAEELSDLGPYLEIERIRRGEAVHLAVAADDEAADEPVPPGLIQPLVRQALHGGEARLTATSDGDWLTLVVVAAGGAPPDPNAPEVAGVRERLALLPGGATTLRATADGVELRLRLDAGSAAAPPAPATLPAAGNAPPAGSQDWPRSWTRLGWAAFLLWLAYDAAAGFGSWLGVPLRAGGSIGPVGAAALAAYGTTVAGVVVLLAFWLVRRAPLRGRRWLRNAAVLVGGGLAAGVGVWASRIALVLTVRYVHRTTPLGALAVTVPEVMANWVLLVGLAHVGMMARWYRQREIGELRLQGELARAELARAKAELRALKLELNPHFLFNSLNAVHSLLGSRPAEAAHMLRQLAELLRRAVATLGVQEVSLREELAGLRPFLEIERIRYGDRLAIEWAVAEEAMAATVPHMILQPLVENAVKHGLGPRGGSGRVEVGARVAGARLLLTVRDSGVGPGAAREAGTGVGLSNLRARLGELYRDRATFDLVRDGEETTATVDLPLRTLPEPEGTDR